jgi:hypothetical protein
MQLIHAQTITPPPELVGVQVLMLETTYINITFRLIALVLLVSVALLKAKLFLTTPTPLKHPLALQEPLLIHVRQTKAGRYQDQAVPVQTVKPDIHAMKVASASLRRQPVKLAKSSKAASVSQIATMRAATLKARTMAEADPTPQAERSV